MNKTPSELRKDFWEEDSLNGSPIRKQYDVIKRVLSSSDNEWTEIQLKNIKLHAIKHTSFYKNYAVNDVFPVVNKTLLTEKRSLFLAKEGFRLPLHISSTSGSTGTPFSVVQDFDKRMRTIADLKVFGELCNYPSHERLVFFRVLSSHLNRTPEQEARENIYYVDSSNLDEKRLSEMLDIIIDKKPRMIFSYSSTLIELAKYILKKGTKPDMMQLTTVLCGGEGLSQTDRFILEQAFGCKVYRRYSDMEMGILGQDNGDGGAYVLNWGSYYFECLQLDNDKPAKDREVGRIVVSDLFNYAQPMIRYDTGDLGIIIRPTNGEFPYFEEVLGRHRDCIYSVDGDLISPAKISVSMWGMEDIKQWQFIQNDKNDYTLKLNCDEDYDYSEILSSLKTILGKTANVDVSIVDEIPVNASNKRSAVICNYKKI